MMWITVQIVKNGILEEYSRGHHTQSTTESPTLEVLVLEERYNGVHDWGVGEGPSGILLRVWRLVIKQWLGEV